MIKNNNKTIKKIEGFDIKPIVDFGRAKYLSKVYKFEEACFTIGIGMSLLEQRANAKANPKLS